MPDNLAETGHLLHLARDGDKMARERLISHSCEHLRNLASRMLKGYPGVKRWEQTDDVLQNALLRLCRALEAVKPESPRHFYNLASLQIRRELIDLAHHHMGPRAYGAKHETNGFAKGIDDNSEALANAPDASCQPASLEDWTRFHQAVEALPEVEREVFGLIWYEGLTQEEVGAVLEVPLRTVKRRWQAARIKIARLLDGEMPQ